MRQALPRYNCNQRERSSQGRNCLDRDKYLPALARRNPLDLEDSSSFSRRGDYFEESRLIRLSWKVTSARVLIKAELLFQWKISRINLVKLEKCNFLRKLRELNFKRSIINP